MRSKAIAYVVTSGTYSEYTIHAVFSTKAKAENFIAAFSGWWDTPHIEEYEIDSFVDDAQAGKKPYLIQIDRAGNIEELLQVESLNRDNDVLPDFETIIQNDGPYFVGCGSALIHACFARSHISARKIANDRRRQLIAEHRWPVKGGDDDA